MPGDSFWKMPEEEAPDDLPFGVSGGSDPMAGVPALVGKLASGLMNIPKNLIDSASQFDPNDIHGSTARVVGPAADTAMALAGMGAPAAEAGSAGIFGGRLARTADLDKLAWAQKAEAAGKHPDDIWKGSEWLHDPADDQWKFEIPDNKIKLNYFPTEKGATATGNAGDMVNHPDLYAAYPEIKNFKFSTTNEPKSGPTDNGTGVYNPDDKSIGINTSGYKEGRPLAAHELQHAVQDLEGFSPGTNPGVYARARSSGQLPEGMGDLTNMQLYLHSAGENEAYNVANRLDMSPLQRLLVHPWKTRNINDRIIGISPHEPYLNALRNIK